jgi:hypothetical protein
VHESAKADWTGASALASDKGGVGKTMLSRLQRRLLGLGDMRARPIAARDERAALAWIISSGRFRAVSMSLPRLFGKNSALSQTIEEK